MDPKVKLELERLRADDPLGRSEDPFADFREVLLLGLEHRFRYRHSLGKSSRFFLALEEGVLLATRCERCGRVWLPPRPVCPNDLQVTRWTELSGKGTLESWTLCPRAPHYARTGEPYLLAYVALEGVSTLFLHQLRGVGPDALQHGMELHAVFGNEPVDHPLERFWFEPLEL
ncbi:MAG: Zn-ribbon domain-containing OB-fold protein [Gemmatimonadota bacterium]|nr:MAG: Zn-ribbon domain-containing OB-fold protein [Gemmatimonadota bacterium]UCH25452.1 MAG: Zn-ribbon domain-containing OB-fold protein [Trueperaceae bacterium]